MLDRVPHVERRDGRDFWILDGKVVGGISANLGVPFVEWDTPGRHSMARSYDTVVAGSFNPVERLKDYDRDGVDAAVLFPNGFIGFAGDPLYSIKEPEVRLRCIQAYNDWLVEEFCAPNPQRLIPLCVLPSWDAALAAAEARRAVKIGHRGVIFGAAMDVFGQPATFDPYWDPLWAAAQEMDIPVSLHQPSSLMDRPTVKGATPPEIAPAINRALGVWHVCTLVPVLPELILCGILDRFPRLKFFLAEAGVGWIPFVLNQCDYTWERIRRTGGPETKLRPSDYWRRNFTAGFWSEPITEFLVEYLGAETMMWEADYPHSITTSPDSQAHIERSLSRITDEATRQRLVGANAATLFKLT